MARIDSSEAEGQAVRVVAQLMAAAARTSPKTRGVDSIQTMVVDGEDLSLLAAEMESKAEGRDLPIFTRDAGSIRLAAAILLVGVTGEPKRPENPFDCGACGNGSCAEFIVADKEEGQDFRGPLCVFQSIDLGIALASAAKVAAEMNIDNRVMYTVGAAARKLGFLPCDVIIGIPISLSGKNPFFDRLPVS